MNDRYFLDTNILVYCFDRDDQCKQSIAETLVGEALSDHKGAISSQVIQEFLNVATRKFEEPMDLLQSRMYLETVLVPLCEVFPSLSLYQQALGIQHETRYSFYDSLIIAGAIETNSQIIYSEDLQAGQSVRGLNIVNPFAQKSPQHKRG
jgi:predicted nucleic acid-binding protein